MNAEQLLQHFERISEAPDALPRLRRFILDLAVRGKLVEQDTELESASELFKLIESEKTLLARQGLIKKVSRTEAVADEDEPFEVPVNWRWVRLGHILLKLTDGTHHSPPNGPEGDFKYITAKNIKPDGLALNDVTYVSREVHEEIYSRCNPVKGDILYIKDGATTGVATVNDLDEPFSMLSSVALLKVPQCILSQLIVLFLRSPFFYDQMRGFMKGAAITRVTLKRMTPALLPLPPLAEQHRIVVKVDELMSLCDQLEAAKAEREQCRARLVAASLQGLNQPAEEEETFREHAHFTFNNLPRITTRVAHIKQLRQTILNLAVRGKLVPQDLSDEPAAELLAKKRKLPTGYLRRRKILKDAAVAAPEELFPKLPTSWAYADIQSLYDLNVVIDYADGNHGSLYPRSTEFGDCGITFVSAKDLVGGRVNWESCSKLHEGWASQLTKGWAQSGDVLLTHNATVGRVARVAEEVNPFLLGTSVTFYRLNQEVLSSDFFFWVLQSAVWQGQLEAIMEQTTRNQVSIQKQAFFRIMIPPLAEQHRIVAKVDELMAICDQLEAQITVTEQYSRRFLESVLAEALAPDSGLREEAEVA